MSKKMTAKSAEKAGVNYAKDQIGSEHFRDWVWSQMSEAARNPEAHFPSNTPEGARRTARNMLQQLGWDTRRELDPREIIGQDPSKETEKAFWAGFNKELEAPSTRDWLTDLVLEFDGDLQKGRGAPAGETLHEAPRTAAFDSMSASQFRDALQAELQSAVGDRHVNVRLSKSWGLVKAQSIYINYINLPKDVGHAGGGAEGENNRMSFWIHGFGVEDAPPPSGKLQIEMSNSALPREYTLRKKTGKPSAIAGYLAEFLGKVAREVQPNFTHTTRESEARRGGPRKLERTSPDGSFGRAGMYRYGPATIWVSGPSGGTWWATIKFRNQEKDVDGKSFDEVIETAKDWIDAAPELNERGGMHEAMMREMRAGSIPPVDDPDYIIQGTYSDGRISEEFGYNHKAHAVEKAKQLLRSPYFEGERVRVITRDGELVWDSRSEQRRRSAEPRRTIGRRR